MKKVLVSGCFDLLHAGHVEFLNRAAEFGELYVSVASDKTIEEVKNLKPTFNEEERLFMVKNLKPVKDAFIAKKATGILDFSHYLDEIKPDILVMNHDGHYQEKIKLCEEHKIALLILDRTPKQGLPKRSSTELRAKKSKIPYRIDIAGAWMDQPFVSKFFPGGVITISLEPTIPFNFRSGFATSTRNRAIKLWGDFLPEGDSQHLAKILFSYDNPPGTKEVAGSQDSIGIMVPNLNFSYYDGEYWPKEIINIEDTEIIDWLEDKIYIIELKPREEGYDVHKNLNITMENVKRLADASKKCFDGILEKNFKKFAEGFTESFYAQAMLLPSTFPEWVKPIIEEYKNKGAAGWKLPGAGGGGYLILVSEKPIENAIRIKIRRK